MLHFHATQKLLNTSHINPLLYVSSSSPDQHMQNWYVFLSGSGFPGKFLLLYVHEPSLLTVMVKGKTIASTIDSFRSRLKDLLMREQFPNAFIQKELSYANEYVIGKTNSRSMLAHINQMSPDPRYLKLRYSSYEEIDCTQYEDSIMEWPYRVKNKPGYTSPRKYWKNLLGESQFS